MIELMQADITTLAVDAIVNAANRSLLGGGGVDGAIHRAGGKAILQACQHIRATQGGCATGQAVITPAGRLPAKWVIHTVGPVWQGGGQGEAALLAACYRNSLNLAREYQLHSIGFPNISTGAYGYPKLQAADIAISSVHAYLARYPDCFERIIFVCHAYDNHALYHALLSGAAQPRL